ncbi:heavy metal-associated isoprenylated plant protein 47-like [Corylus avellana]|uniref:heavy metal-associated isoprenylated plant protein 47-like n=1 Tax=Corylus avellana TaxID=13451 RepID=UPI001E231747|nr:heavy metal-associated isoprenylated plant protein 47-like [Corylus avellana]
MKQKIVIKVQMSSEKCRTKAMKIAVTADGVSSVAIQGSENDQLVVSGEGVDPANLTCLLRKKLCPATLLSVEEVKEKGEEKPEKKPEVHSFSYLPQFPVYHQLYQPNPNYYVYENAYDPYPADNCSIM